MEPLYSETYLEAMMPKERRQKRNLMIAICIILPIVDLCAASFFCCSN